MMMRLHNSIPVMRGHHLNMDKVLWYLAMPGVRGGTTRRDLMGRYHGTQLSALSTTYWTGAKGRRGGFGAMHQSAGVSLGTAMGEAAALLPTTTTAATIGMWIMPTNAVNTAQVLMEFTGSSSADQRFGIMIGRAGTASRFSAFFRNSANTLTFLDFAAVSGIVLNTWVWLGAVVAGTSVILYINGRSVNSALTVDSTNTFGSFGTRQARTGATEDGTNVFVGSSDDVFIYRRALSTARMKDLYEQSAKGHVNTLNWRYIQDYSHEPLIGEGGVGTSFRPQSLSIGLGLSM